MRRRRLDFRQGVQAPLVILGGLPNPICAAVARSIEGRCTPTHRVVFAPSGNDGRQLYKEQTVSTLIKSAAEFAIKHLRTQVTPPTPKHIILAYVPAADEERLLTEFEFFVFPVRLSRLADYDEHGRQLRHDLNIGKAYVFAELDTALRQFAEVKRRLSSASDREALFLPPRNFKTSGSERMVDVFRRMVRQTTSWTDSIPGAQRVKVENKDLPRHVRRGAQKTVLEDVRGLLFPSDPSRDGPARELAGDSSMEEMKHFLKSRFRFGVPLIDGYHHDVQYAGRSLRREEFECSREGPVTLTCPYANVYPNDYVRAGGV